MSQFGMDFFPMDLGGIIITFDLWLKILEQQPPSYGIMIIYNGYDDATVGT